MSSQVALYPESYSNHRKTSWNPWYMMGFEHVAKDSDFFQARILGSSIAPKLSKKTHNLGESNLSVPLPLGRDSSGSPEVAGPC
jgi:hypothetical protein